LTDLGVIGLDPERTNPTASAAFQHVDGDVDVLKPRRPL